MPLPNALVSSSAWNPVVFGSESHGNSRPGVLMLTSTSVVAKFNWIELVRLPTLNPPNALIPPGVPVPVSTTGWPGDGQLWLQPPLMSSAQVAPLPPISRNGVGVNWLVNQSKPWSHGEYTKESAPSAGSKWCTSSPTRSEEAARSTAYGLEGVEASNAMRNTSASPICALGNSTSGGPVMSDTSPASCRTGFCACATVARAKNEASVAMRIMIR